MQNGEGEKGNAYLFIAQTSASLSLYIYIDCGAASTVLNVYMLEPFTSHNIDCFLGSFCYIWTVFRLNCLTAQPSYEGWTAVEGGK
jgi:hypothetical protein